MNFETKLCVWVQNKTLRREIGNSHCYSKIDRKPRLEGVSQETNLRGKTSRDAAQEEKLNQALKKDTGATQCVLGFVCVNRFDPCKYVRTLKRCSIYS
ncbi:hypothetical protein L596_006226 [Steinernema carpocapsae]|uniref:Uncharacterized protein n=1 Tax=Steinernema carpocapsae TaxID=34508 RepID=A0A4U8V2X7_STECR|nr:hypothetical protein L596_006226 [Steinernema carpocapsae]